MARIVETPGRQRPYSAASRPELSALGGEYDSRPMPAPFQDAISTITRYIEHSVHGVSARSLGGNTVAIDVRRGSNHAVLRYGPELDDLEQALNDPSLPARYKNGVIRDYT